jgi:methyl-accepting chemotaxis protein
MSILSRLKLRTKFALLLGLSALGVVASIAISSSLMQQRMVDDRVDKLHAMVDAAIGIAQLLEGEVTAGRLTHDQALEHLHTDIHGMRFDAGSGYVIVRRDSTIILHGADPKLEGKASSTVDAQGVPLAKLIENALQGTDRGVVSYLFPKPGEAQPQPKVSYVARFAPWQVVFFAGAYVDDLHTVFMAILLRLSAVGAAILAATLATAWFINRDITGSLGRLHAVMTRLANGELTADIPGTDRRDEVGSMAGAVLVFKDQMIKAERITAEQAKEHERSEATKRAALMGMAETIETETAASLQQIGQLTAAMATTSDELSASATRTGASAESATSAAAQALANAQTVASAAEQLTASIRKIGAQVNQSSAVVGRAVEAGLETRKAIETLNQEVERIGAVADIIGEIAAKTNLLALNATIEAARAGDAGKGFAVVASEVKQLATQTARSTEEIGRHIAQVSSATGASVAAVEQIERTITEVNTISSSIAAAVEEQEAATAEIARNVTETASAANEMTIRIKDVSKEATETDRHAIEVRENTAGLNSAVEELQHTVMRVVRSSSQ